jgi:multidrug efflux pump subunit AcrA (membrane-fusion protein)
MDDRDRDQEAVVVEVGGASCRAGAAVGLPTALRGYYDTVRGGPAALSAGCVLLLAMTAGSCGGSGEIRIGVVGRADLVELVDTPVAVVASAVATLTAGADGTLTELLVSSGDEVVSGDELAVVDSPSAQRRLEQAEEALRAATLAAAGGGLPAQTPQGGDLGATQDAIDGAAAEALGHARTAAGQVADPELRGALLAQMDAAEQRYASAAAAAREAVRAVERGVASLASAVAALATAQRVQAQQAYELARATVDGLTLRAPFAGVVQLGGAPAAAPGAAAVPGPAAAPGTTAPGVAPEVVAGAPVSAGTPVVTVVDLSEPAAVAEVSEVEVLRVAPGLAAQLELLAVPGARYSGTVTDVDLLPRVGDRVGYRVRLILGSGTRADRTAAPKPRPGMTGTAHLVVAEASDTLAVPAGAVMVVDGVESVWAVRAGRAQRLPVTVGVRGRELVQVVAGLEAGDRIVVGGTGEVRTGQRLPP